MPTNINLYSKFLVLISVLFFISLKDSSHLKQNIEFDQFEPNPNTKSDVNSDKVNYKERLSQLVFSDAFEQESNISSQLKRKQGNIEAQLLDLSLWRKGVTEKDNNPKKELLTKIMWHREIVGRVLFCKGVCSAYRKSKPYRLQKMSMLQEGDEINTLKDSSLWIALAGGEVLFLGEQTRVHLREINISKKSLAYYLRVSYGYIKWYESLLKFESKALVAFAAGIYKNHGSSFDLHANSLKPSFINVWNKGANTSENFILNFEGAKAKLEFNKWYEIDSSSTKLFKLSKVPLYLQNSLSLNLSMKQYRVDAKQSALKKIEAALTEDNPYQIARKYNYARWDLLGLDQELMKRDQFLLKMSLYLEKSNYEYLQQMNLNKKIRNTSSAKKESKN